MKHGKYKGADAELIGKTAMLMDRTPGYVAAQFDDRSLKQAFGWWHFKESDFEIYPEEVFGWTMFKENQFEIPVMTPVVPEKINHPQHYGGDTTYETVKVIEAWDLGFRLGNVVKYISRAGKKNDALEDLKKARWYLDREIQWHEAVRP